MVCKLVMVHCFTLMKLIRRNVEIILERLFQSVCILLKVSTTRNLYEVLTFHCFVLAMFLSLHILYYGITPFVVDFTVGILKGRLCRNMSLNILSRDC